MNLAFDSSRTTGDERKVDYIMPEEENAERKHLIIYDGDCGMCRRTIAWVGRRDAREEFTAIPFQQAHMLSQSRVAWSPAMYEACKRAVHVVERDGTILRAGRAMLFILERIGWAGGRLPRLLARQPFVSFVEIGYSVVARNRNFFSRFVFRPRNSASS